MQSDRFLVSLTNCTILHTFFCHFRYEEVCKPGYNFETGKFTMKTGHFTQVVWKSSKELGIGKATGTHDGVPCTYIVARYRPPGNYQGKFQTEVQRGSFTKEVCKNLPIKRNKLPLRPGRRRQWKTLSFGRQ